MNKRHEVIAAIVVALLILIGVAWVLGYEPKPSDYQLNVSKSGYEIKDGERTVANISFNQIPALDSLILKDNQ